MTTIKSSGAGRCIWCCQKKDGVVAEFQDGLQGHLCWADFRKAVKVRTQKQSSRSSEAPQGS